MRRFPKTYDAVVSIGQWCATAICMKKLGLRSASGPFDWLFGGGERVKSYVDLMLSGFSGFFLRDNLRKVREDPAEGTEVYVDVVQGWEFRHDFSVGVPFEENYAKSRARFDRRIARLLGTLRSKGRVMLVHWLGEGRYKRDEVVADMRRLRSAFPGTAIDLLVLETEKFAKGVSYDEPEPGVFFAVGDFYDQSRHDAVIGDERLVLSVLGRIRLRGRWRNLLHVRAESMRRHLRRLVSKMGRR